MPAGENSRSMGQRKPLCLNYNTSLIFVAEDTFKTHEEMEMMVSRTKTVSFIEHLVWPCF